MLLGDLSRDDYALSLPPVFAQLCAKLKTLDLLQLPLGWQELAEGIQMNVMEFNTAEASSKQSELHRKFVDIQLLISGEELIEYSLSQPTLSLYDEYREEEDYQLTSALEYPNQIILQPNMFAIFLTNEPHKPGCHVREGVSQTIRKLVVKVPIEYVRG